MLNASFLRIKNIELTGNNFVSAKEISFKIKEVSVGKTGIFFNKDGFFFFPEEKIEIAILENFLRVKEVSVKKKIFSGLAVEIKERENVVLACRGQECYFADENGFVFEKAPDFSGGLYLKIYDERNDEENNGIAASSTQPKPTMVVGLGASVLPTEEFKNLFLFAGKVNSSINEVVKIILKDEGVYEIFVKEGWKIMLKENSEPKVTFSNLITALDSQIKDSRKKLDYIDLRFGNKVYFKYK